MTTFLAHVMNELEAGHEGPAIPEAKLTFFRHRLRGRFFDFIRERFEREEIKGLTQAKLARRIGKSPEVINRWLSTPSNLTLDSMSDLMVGIAAEEPAFGGISLLNRAESNYEHLDDEVVSAQLPMPKQDDEFKDATKSALTEARKGFQQGEASSDQQARSLAQDNAYPDQRKAAHG